MTLCVTVQAINNLMDITPHNVTTWREVYIVTLQRQHHRPFQFIWDPYVYSLYQVILCVTVQV